MCMKKIVSLALWLCASAFADIIYVVSPNSDDGSTAPSVSTPAPKQQGYRSSFFMSFDLGCVITFVPDREEHWGSGDAYDLGFERKEFYSNGSYFGYGASIEAKMGVLIKQLVAVYAVAGAFESEGTYEIESSDSVGVLQKHTFNQATSKHFYGGVGATIYPFREESHVMNGFYSGVLLGLDLGGLSYGNRDGVGSINTHLQIEVGKEFDVGKRWKLGIGLAGAVFSVIDGGEYYKNYFVQLAFHVTRR